MELNNPEIIKIFKRNFNFEIVDTKLGTAVKMDVYNAFIFSVVTGAGYFDNPIYTYSPKGLIKLFYNAFNYKFVSGIFENTSLKNTPYLLAKAKPFLFDTDFKYIIPIEFKSEAELQKKLKIGLSEISNPTDYIILRIEKSKKGNGMESFMEYLAAEYFKKLGFIVENQIPLAHSVGSPDFGGYSVNEIAKNVKPFLNEGFHVIELAMIRLKYNLQIQEFNSNNNQNIVGEAKTSSTQMTKQLHKYLDTDLFDYGFEIHPYKKNAKENYFGLLTLNSDLEIVFYEPTSIYNPKKNLSRNNYSKWLCNYLKFYLLSNLTNDELNEFYQDNYDCRISSQNDLVNFINQISTKNLINQIKKII